MNAEKYRYGKNSLLNLFLFLIVYFCIQDFAGALLYTNFNLPKIFFYFHLFLGEVILFSLFFYIITGTEFKIFSHKKLLSLVAFSILVIIYYFAFSSYKFSFTTLKELRCLLLPIVLVYLSYYLISTRQKRRRFFRFLIFLSFGLALFGIFETLFLPNKWWFNYANMSLYLNQIKGYGAPYPQLGITGETMGRRGYREFLPRRLASTFGDPFGYAVGMSVSIVIFLYLFLKAKKIRYLLGLLITSGALFLTFTRSGYILSLMILFIFWLLILNKKQKLFSIFIFILLFPLMYNFLASFISLTVSELTRSSAHYNGFISFYTSIIMSGKYWIGMGVAGSRRVESGYTYLMTQLGILGFVAFLTFIFSSMSIVYRNYRKARQKEESTEFINLSCVNAIALGILISTVILLNFYGYPFSMTTYMINWIIVGIALRASKIE